MKAKRESLGLTQRQVAALADRWRKDHGDGGSCSEVMVQSIEAGTRLPSADLLAALVVVLDMDADEVADIEAMRREAKRSQSQDEALELARLHTAAMVELSQQFVELARQMQEQVRRLAAVEEALGRLDPSPQPRPTDCGGS